jgi:anti-repressor protein
LPSLTGRRHDQVLRTARELVEQGVTQSVETLYRHEQNGVEYPEHRLNKRDSLVIVAQLSPAFTARLVDRWQELEAAALKAPDMSDPHALRALCWATRRE